MPRSRFLGLSFHAAPRAEQGSEFFLRVNEVVDRCWPLSPRTSEPHAELHATSCLARPVLNGWLSGQWVRFRTERPDRAQDTHKAHGDRPQRARRHGKLNRSAWIQAGGGEDMAGKGPTKTEREKKEASLESGDSCQKRVDPMQWRRWEISF